MKRLPVKKYPELFRKTFKEFMEDEPLKYSAAISYYTIFALPGILILTLYVAGLFLGEKAVSGELANQADNLLGPEAANQIQEIIVKASQPAKGWLMKTVGIVTLIISATTAFGALQDALNAMWEVKARKEKGWLRMLITRLVSLAMIISIGFLLLVSLAVDALLAILQHNLQDMLPSISYPVMYLINLTVSLAIFTLMFAMVYKVLPDATVQWRNVWMGAMITAVLFIIGKFAIGLYLGNSDFTNTYGAAGSLVVILAWVYYASLILLFGAELTQVYSKMTYSRIEPARHAVKIKWTAVEE